MENINKCPSIYEGLFSKPFFIERLILIIYALILIIGLVGNMMTIIIIKYNKHLRTPTNFYLLNLAVSDLMMLMCNLPLEMIEIHYREWPLSIVFCKLRNICAEFFTCSSILTILAFTCERYFAIVHPIHFHQLSHFRRAQNIIIIIWLISLGFSLPLGLSYEIENSLLKTSTNPPTLLFRNNNTKLIKTTRVDTLLTISCKACVPKQSVEKLLSIIIIITSICFFYFPMIIIGAIYLFVGKALRRVNKYETCANQIKLSLSSQTSNRLIRRKYTISSPCHSGLSNKETAEVHRQGSHINSYSWLKMRARCQARQVVVKTLIAVVIAFFVCYAPLYLQRLLLAIMTLNSNLNSESPLFSNFMAYLYIMSGITFYFGSAINPILYNVVSNKYRRAFCDLFCCRLKYKRKSNLKQKNQKLFQTNRPQKQKMNYCVNQQQQPQEANECNTKKLCENTVPKTPLNIKIPVLTYSYSSSIRSQQKNKRSNSYQ